MMILPLGLPVPAKASTQATDIAVHDVVSGGMHVLPLENGHRAGSGLDHRAVSWWKG
jgi:hypothetical protein